MNPLKYYDSLVKIANSKVDTDIRLSTVCCSEVQCPNCYFWYLNGSDGGDCSMIENKKEFAQNLLKYRELKLKRILK